ncbi:MAG: hypothetical protein ACI959_001343 [Limisphaerales bacterium]|jgi:hypothetical protein
MDYRSRVRSLFFLLPPLLLLCLAMSMVGLEPYPAILFPQFGESGDGSGSISFEEPEFTKFVNGNAIRIGSDEILKNLPSSFRSAVLQNRFRYPNGDLRPEKRMETNLGGKKYIIKRSPRVWSEKTEIEFCQSLLTKTLEVDSLSVQWFKVGGKPGSINRTALPGILSIHLGGMAFKTP